MALFHRTILAETRPLDSQWASECAAIHAASFAHSWTAIELENLLTAPNVVADAAHDMKSVRLYGFVLSRVAAGEAEVLTLAVDQAMRRRGIATNLVEGHLSRLQSAGIKALFLEVDEQNSAARALYARFGFETVGRRVGYYRGRDGSRTSALILRRDMD